MYFYSILDFGKDGELECATEHAIWTRRNYVPWTYLLEKINLNKNIGVTQFTFIVF